MSGTKDKNNRFVEWLLERLAERKWSLTDLSQKIGDKDVSAIYRIAARQRNLGELKARQIADALGVSHAELFAEAGLINTLTPTRGKNDAPVTKTQRRAKGFAELIEEIENDDEQDRITQLVEALIKQAIEQSKPKSKTGRASRATRVSNG